MKLRAETICGVCKNVFCCEKCREKHETKAHGKKITEKKFAANIYEKIGPSLKGLCPICDNKPFPLHEEINPKVLEHIKQHHLPLHCRKCAKVYTEVGDLREFSKCTKYSTALHGKQCIAVSGKGLKNPMFEFEKLESLENRSTQISPIMDNGGRASLTPIPLMNVQWKARTGRATQDISDSVSSIKNLSNFSLISNSSSIKHSLGTSAQGGSKGKLVRTTSTPVYGETNVGKPKEQTFNASEAQVSSIYNSGCDMDQQNSPVKCSPHSTSPARHPQSQLEAVNLYKKFNSRTKVAAVTPLRQVMSKSIQKAFAEHGLPSFSDQKPLALNEIMFGNSPLDLRLSPALRRCQSDTFSRIGKNCELEKESMMKKKTCLQRAMCSSPQRHYKQQLTTESVVYTCTQQVSTLQASSSEATTGSSHLDMEASNISPNTIYKTCESIKIISKVLNEDHDELRPLKMLQHAVNTNNLAQITPNTRQSGAILTKKVINFETPTNENDSHCETPNNEKFYTPKSSPRVKESLTASNAATRNLSGRFSPSPRRSIRERSQSTTLNKIDIDESDVHDDEVFLSATTLQTPNENEKSRKTTGNGGFLWSLMNTVIRKGKGDNDSKQTSIIKRCASLAGSLVCSTSLVDDTQLQSLKRKRMYSFDVQTNPRKPISKTASSPDLETAAFPSKRFRIQARKPIERMRNNS